MRRVWGCRSALLYGSFGEGSVGDMRRAAARMRDGWNVHCELRPLGSALLP